MKTKTPPFNNKYYEIKNSYKIEVLKSTHDRGNFNCNFSDLNEFIQKDALYQQECNLSVSYVVSYKKDIISYFSLLSDLIELKNLSSKLKDLNYDKI